MEFAHAATTDLLPRTPSRRCGRRGRRARARRRPGDASSPREFGTPLVVYDEATLRAQARAYRAAPGALVVYGTKAFPSIAVLQLFAEEGLGADVSTVGELEFARRAGIPGDRLVIHGNNKEDELLQGSVEAGALIVLDSLDELERARALGAKRCLIRVTPGIEADTHEAIKTAHHGSKFGLPPDDAIEALRRLPDAEGLHVHVGSQLMHFGASLMTVDWVAQFAARARPSSAGRRGSSTSAAASACGTCSRSRRSPSGSSSAASSASSAAPSSCRACPPPQLMLEPGRSLVSRAGVTLYTVGASSAPAPRRRT